MVTLGMPVVVCLLGMLLGFVAEEGGGGGGGSLGSTAVAGCQIIVWLSGGVGCVVDVAVDVVVVDAAADVIDAVASGISDISVELAVSGVVVGALAIAPPPPSVVWCCFGFTSVGGVRAAAGVVVDHGIGPESWLW